MRDARTLRVEVSPAIGTEVDGMREPCRTRRGTELGQTSRAFREVQVPQSDAGNNDCHYPNDPTREDIAECEQSHRNHRNGDGDSAHLQCAAGAALEVSADRLSHTPLRPRELWDEGLYCGISFDDPSISGPAAGTRLEEECVSDCFQLPLRIVNEARLAPRRDVYSNVEISDEVLARL